MPSELTIEQRRVLQLLAEAPNGYTEAALRARGFTPTLLVELAAYGYVVARPETMKAAGKTFGFMRFVITDSGRTAIGGRTWASPSPIREGDAGDHEGGRPVGTVRLAITERAASGRAGRGVYGWATSNRVRRRRVGSTHPASAPPWVSIQVADI
jgi:hypothetical protein